MKSCIGKIKINKNCNGITKTIELNIWLIKEVKWYNLVLSNSNIMFGSFSEFLRLNGIKETLDFFTLENKRPADIMATTRKGYRLYMYPRIVYIFKEIDEMIGFISCLDKKFETEIDKNKVKKFKDKLILNEI